MLKFIKEKAARLTAVAERKRVQLKVEAIHNDFYTETSRLLEQAKISASKEFAPIPLVNDKEVLSNLGFIKSANVEGAKLVEEKNRLLKAEKEQAERDNAAIMHFALRYPCHKLITQQSVKKLCEKWGLIFGPVNKFIGTVPEKNLREMAEFKVNPEDRCYFRKTATTRGDWDSIMPLSEVEAYIGKKSPGSQAYIDDASGNLVLTPSATDVDEFKFDIPWATVDGVKQLATNSGHIVGECPMLICAPTSDFDVKNMILTANYELTKDPDPIVLMPLIYRHVRYFLILTAWGPEASDVDVVNERNN